MRRMYSEQELSKIIKEVFDAEVEAGEFDETIADYVDAYLVEHPVDITALEGQDVSVNSLDADGLITGGEIVEKMSGYSFVLDSVSENITLNVTYASVVKTGNKITFVWAFEVERTDTVTSSISRLGDFVIPASIGAKLYPYTLGWSNDILTSLEIELYSSLTGSVTLKSHVVKDSNTNIGLFGTNFNSALELGTTYIGRAEVTFLLSENLAPEE